MPAAIANIQPTVGMAVTWIDPESNPVNAPFIREHLIKQYGADGLVIASVSERYANGKLRRDGPLVTLARHGTQVMEGWDEKMYGKESDFHKSLELVVSWAWLRPI